jgi:hypothetical protein
MWVLLQDAGCLGIFIDPRGKLFVAVIALSDAHLLMAYFCEPQYFHGFNGQSSCFCENYPPPEFSNHDSFALT